MLSVRSAVGDGTSTVPSEAEIKRSYKRGNTELKQRLSELETRLNETRLRISQLEDGAKQATEENSKVKRAPSKSTSTNENGRKTGLSVPGNEDTDASISLTNAPLSIKPGDELHPAMTGSCHQNLPSSPSLHHDRASNKSQVAGREEQEGQNQSSDRLPQPPSLSKIDDTHFEQTRTPPVLKPNPPYLNLTETVPGLANRPITSAIWFFWRFRATLPTLTPTGASTSPKPQSAKKTRISAGKALKHSLSKFTKPFGRRSDVVISTSPLNMTKSISDEHIPTSAYGNITEASNLPKIPSVMNTRTLSPS
nr:hypothetical transcript [Hymenolepis microstoma]